MSTKDRLKLLRKGRDGELAAEWSGNVFYVQTTDELWNPFRLDGFEEYAVVYELARMYLAKFGEDAQYSSLARLKREQLVRYCHFQEDDEKLSVRFDKVPRQDRRIEIAFRWAAEDEEIRKVFLLKDDVVLFEAGNGKCNLATKYDMSFVIYPVADYETLKMELASYPGEDA